MRIGKQGLKQIMQDYGIRLILCLVCLGLSLLILIKGLNAGSAPLIAIILLLGMAFMILAAIVVAPLIASAMVEKGADFFTYSEKFDGAPPMYSIPQGLRKNRRYEEAIEVYEAIAEEYPNEVKPYIEMIGIAVFDLKDPTRAAQIHQRGIESLQEEEDRALLVRCARKHELNC